jgi:glycerol-3-phosphate acyltransferase PlsX
MGGEKGIRVQVKGAIQFCRQTGGEVEVVLVGDEKRVSAELGHVERARLPIQIHHASETIGMHEVPTQALRRKRDSSIAVGVNLVKDGKVAAFVSAGNTGAVVSGSLLSYGRVPGVHRPALGTCLPATSGVPSLLIDLGANAQNKPEHLVQFAIMGAVFMQAIMGRQDPTVALLSNGEEASKGNDLTRETHALLSQTGLNFVGNVEGGDVLRGVVDVIVCDGFVGNVVLKAFESFVPVIKESVKGQIRQNPLSVVSNLFSIPILRNLKKKLDYAEFGGASLLGVDGVTVVAHGSSSIKAIKNALHVAHNMVSLRLNEQIKKGIENKNVFATYR